MPKIELEVEKPSFFAEFNDPKNSDIHHLEAVLPFYEVKKLKRGNANVRPPESKKRPFQAMVETIENSPNEFHIKNRGITYICTGVTYDKEKKKIIVTIPDYDETKNNKEDVALRYGIADGGHTFEVINRTVAEEKAYEAITNWSMPYARVHFIATKDLKNVEPIVEALNTSTQVQQVTLDEFQNKFASIKAALKASDFDADLVAFREHEDKAWNVVEIIQRMACFLPERWAAHQPVNMYKSKNKALKMFTNEESRGEFKELYPVIADIITLPEYIESQLSAMIVFNKKKGIPNGVKAIKKAPYTRPGTEYQTDYKFNSAITLPLAAAFRVLLKQDVNTSEYDWAVSYKEVWESCAEDLFHLLITRSNKFDIISQISSDVEYWAGAMMIVSRAKDKLLGTGPIVRKRKTVMVDSEDKETQETEN